MKPKKDKTESTNNNKSKVTLTIDKKAAIKKSIWEKIKKKTGINI